MADVLQFRPATRPSGGLLGGDVFPIGCLDTCRAPSGCLLYGCAKAFIRTLIGAGIAASEAKEVPHDHAPAAAPGFETLKFPERR